MRIGMGISIQSAFLLRCPKQSFIVSNPASCDVYGMTIVETRRIRISKITPSCLDK